LIWLTDPQCWTQHHVRVWLTWLMREYNVINQAQLEVYTQYNGRELLKMGKRLFCDLAPSNTSSDVLWEHLSLLHRGESRVICIYRSASSLAGKQFPWQISYQEWCWNNWPTESIWLSVSRAESWRDFLLPSMCTIEKVTPSGNAYLARRQKRSLALSLAVQGNIVSQPFMMKWLTLLWSYSRYASLFCGRSFPSVEVW